jgi:NAD kinase
VVLLVERQLSAEVLSASHLLSTWLKEEGVSVIRSMDRTNNISADNIHLVICLGGDGTILEVSHKNLLTEF